MEGKVVELYYSDLSFSFLIDMHFVKFNYLILNFTVCSDFKQNLVDSLPDGSFINAAGGCSSPPSDIKMGKSKIWSCGENDAVVIDLKAAKRITMVKVMGDWKYARKFQLFSSMDGIEYTKISFDSYDVSIIDSYFCYI